MTILINLYGAPGAGKSTMAADLFAKLKYKGMNCELVREYAKELCWRGTLLGTPQLDILKVQSSRLEDLIGKVDLVITDSPLSLSEYYGDPQEVVHDQLVHMRLYRETIEKKFSKVYNVFVYRVKKYSLSGRIQTEAESDDISNDLLCNHSIQAGLLYDEILDGSEVTATRLANKFYDEFKDN